MFAESSQGYSNFSHDVHGAGLIGLIDQRKWQWCVNGKSSTTVDRSIEQQRVAQFCNRFGAGPVVSSPQISIVIRLKLLKKCESSMNEYG